MGWKIRLTKTPYLVMFVILGTIGVSSAFALVTITLAGNVVVTGDLDVDGKLTSPTISELEAKIGLDALRTYNKNPPYFAPCDKLNADTKTIDHLFRKKASIQQLGFDQFIGNLPIFAEAQEPFVGEIRMFGGTFAPRGWAFTQGQVLPVSDFQLLFSVLGFQYGGDGRTTFALPDLRCLEPEGNTGPHYIIALDGFFPTQE